MPATAARRRWEGLLAAVLLVQLCVAATVVLTQPKPAPSSCTVLAQGRSDRLSRELQRECQAAVPAVTRVWGADWSRQVVIVVPASPAELAGMVPEGGDLAQVAAVVGAGQRVYVNPVAFARLSPVGRRVVLLHEITHVASGASQARLPSWLVEGLADYVGFLASGIPVRTAAAELRARVVAGQLPSGLPADADFDGAAASVAYQESWLAVSLLARLRGQAAVIRFYRAVRGGSTVDGALHRLLGMSTAQLTVAWRHDVSALA